MRLLLFIGGLGTGGAERQMSVLAEAMAARGHEVSLITLYPGGQNWDELSRANGIQPTALFASRPGRFGVALDLITAAFRLRSSCRGQDVIYSSLLLTNIIAWLATRGRYSTRLVWGFRASSYRESWKLHWPFQLCRLLADTVPLVIANSGQGKKLLEQSGFVSERTLIIRNGIDTRRFCYDPDGRESLRRAWGIKAGERVVGIVGRLTPVKGHDIFLQAAQQVRATDPSIRFVCLGGGEPEYVDRLRSMEKDLALDGSVLWLAEQPATRAIYSAMDVYCMASRFEGFPNALSEALACGVPCVATNVGEAALLIDDAGCLVAPGDAFLLASAILNVLGDDIRTGADRLSRRIREHHSVDKMADQFESAFVGIAAHATEGTE